MPKDPGDSHGCASWIKWIVGTMVALLAAGTGIVALLNYFEGQKEQEWQAYQRNLEQWNNFSPTSLSGIGQEIILRGLDRIDLESGLISSNPQTDRAWDLLFVCGPNGYEALRALDEVSWQERGVANFDSISYRDIRDADYQMRVHNATGYNDLYYAHMSNVPGQDYIFFIRTPERNVAKLQILGYDLVDNNPFVCRNMRLRYEVFPFIADLPRPQPPD